MVTHELASAFLIADRMILLDKGVIVADATTQEMRASTQPRVRQFLDRVPEPEVDARNRLLADADGRYPADPPVTALALAQLQERCYTPGTQAGRAVPHREIIEDTNGFKA